MNFPSIGIARNRTSPGKTNDDKHYACTIISVFLYENSYTDVCIIKHTGKKHEWFSKIRGMIYICKNRIYITVKFSSKHYKKKIGNYSFTI